LAGNLVVGRVVYFHCDDRIYNDGKIKHQDIHAIGRMGGPQYTRTIQRFEMVRPKAD